MQVLVTNSLGGKAFPTKELNNKCVTNVVFTDVDSKGKHQVCLKSWYVLLNIDIYSE